MIELPVLCYVKSFMQQKPILFRLALVSYITKEDVELTWTMQ